MSRVTYQSRENTQARVNVVCDEFEVPRERLEASRSGGREEDLRQLFDDIRLSLTAHRGRADETANESDQYLLELRCSVVLRCGVARGIRRIERSTGGAPTSRGRRSGLGIRP